MVNKQIFIIAYDISNNRRRRRVAKLLEAHGVRMNKSVFECFLTPASFKKLSKIINQKIDSKNDSVLYYPLCRNCFEKSEKTGRADFDPPLVVV